MPVRCMAMLWLMLTAFSRATASGADEVRSPMPPPSSSQWSGTISPREPAAEAPLPMFRQQAVQRIFVNSGALAASELSSGYLETGIELGVPLGSFDNILGVTPSFRVDFLDAVSGADLPSELFQTGVQFFWRRKISDRWSTLSIVQPSVRSDFRTSKNAVRLFGMSLLTREVVPNRLKVAFGAVYLDRNDLPLLPAVGLTWTPDVRTRVDLRFPQSQVSWRLQKDGAQSELWGRFSAGLGGDTWAVQRATVGADELTLRDWRFLIGLEKREAGKRGWFVDAGVAVGRRYEFERTQTEVGLDPGFLIQVGLNF